LHEEIPQSELIVLPGLGHMVHHLAPDQVTKAIDRAAELVGVATQSKRAPVSRSTHQARAELI
jgi:hypothetical protein